MRGIGVSGSLVTGHWSLVIKALSQWSLKSLAIVIGRWRLAGVFAADTFEIKFT